MCKIKSINIFAELIHILTLINVRNGQLHSSYTIFRIGPVQNFPKIQTILKFNLYCKDYNIIFINNLIYKL